MPRLNMNRSVPEGATETERYKGLIPVSPQTAMELRPYLEWREIVYRALRDSVDEGYLKRSTFADDVGKTTGEVSLRLRHADDDRGYQQLAPIDYLATLALKPGALERFIAELAEAKGLKLESAHPLTPEEKLKIIAAELTEKRRRQLERENNLPSGALEP